MELLPDRRDLRRLGPRQAETSASQAEVAIDACIEAGGGRGEDEAGTGCGGTAETCQCKKNEAACHAPQDL